MKSFLTVPAMGNALIPRCQFIRRVMPLLIAAFGAVATASTQTSPAKSSAGDDLFTNSAIRRLSIEIAPAGIAELRNYRWRRDASDEDRKDVPATVREGDTVWTNVAVHLKGAAGSFRPVDTKPALTLNFDKFADGQRFHGLQKISLNNSVQDSTYFNEKLSREIFVKAGVPVPRSDYALVELNGRALGLYVLVEGWNKQFLRRYFDNVQGNLYDGAFGRDISRELPVNSGKNPEDQSELKTLQTACFLPDFTGRLNRLGTLVDLERFYTLLALDTMLWNWDGYSMNRNNYRLFHDQSSGRLVFMPHGLDQLFWKADGPIVTGTKGIVAYAVLETPEGRRRCLEKVRELRAGLFNAEALTNRIQKLAERIRPAVSEMGFGIAVRFSAEVRIIQKNIAERIANIDEQLEGLRGLLQFTNEETTVSLVGWKTPAGSEDSTLSSTNDTSMLHIQAKSADTVGAWVTKVWLEEGSYRVTARIKARVTTVDPDDRFAGAGLRVQSHRKMTDGSNWDWFPYRESRNPQTRGILPPLKTSRRLTGTNDWTEVTYDFDLRQPMADLEIRCELRANDGEAWFDRESLKIRRIRREDSKPQPARR